MCEYPFRAGLFTFDQAPDIDDWQLNQQTDTKKLKLKLNPNLYIIR